MSKAEQALELQLRALKVAHEREYRFAAHATGGTGRGCRQRIRQAGMRDWRADFRLLGAPVLVEVEGGAWLSERGGKSRHTTGAGFHADMLKYDAAMRLGWTVYRCDPAMIRSGRAVKTIEHLMQSTRGTA